MGDNEITVYTMTGCQHCVGVKAYLEEKGLAFTERNVLEDDKAMEDFRKLGFRGTPVIIIGDETVVGFDRAKLLSGQIPCGPSTGNNPPKPTGMPLFENPVSRPQPMSRSRMAPASAPAASSSTIACS